MYRKVVLRLVSSVKPYLDLYFHLELRIVCIHVLGFLCVLSRT